MEIKLKHFLLHFPDKEFSFYGSSYVILSPVSCSKLLNIRIDISKGINFKKL